MKKILIAAILALSIAPLNSCRDQDLEPTLAQDKDLETSLRTETDLRIYMNGVYSIMRDVNYMGRDYIIYNEVRSDNAFSNGNSNRFVIEAEMDYNPNVGNMPSTWYRIYQVIGRANAVINRGADSFTGDKDAINHMIGQAYVLRAMAHFDLVRIFGQHYVGSGGMQALGVPYVKIFKGDPQNMYPSRNTVQEVYNFAKEDVETGIKLMNPSKDDTSTKNYITTTGGWGLLSRMAIYFKDYQTALTASRNALNNPNYGIIPASAFVNSWKSKGSRNWIFSIYSNTANEALGINGLAYIYRQPPTGAGYGDIQALGNLYDIFDANDIRRSPQMVSPKVGDGAGEFRNMGKYPDTANGGDDIPVIRYEEIVLNYAEALLQTGDATGALVQLNRIPENRNASLYAVASMENILLERRKELAFEGMRFHDLVRTGQGVPLLDPVRQRMKKTIPYGDPKLAFPIPNTEIGVNANIKQNAGY